MSYNVEIDWSPLSGGTRQFVHKMYINDLPFLLKFPSDPTMYHKRSNLILESLLNTSLHTFPFKSVDILEQVIQETLIQQPLLRVNF